MSQAKIKQCPYCEKWFSLMDLYRDPEIKLLGMTFEDGDIKINLFYFTHNHENCGTTFAIKVEVFEELTNNMNTLGILAGTEVCERHCLDINDTEECRQDCKYAPYRWLLNEMLKAREYIR